MLSHGSWVQQCGCLKVPMIQRHKPWGKWLVIWITRGQGESGGLNAGGLSAPLWSRACWLPSGEWTETQFYHSQNKGWPPTPIFFGVTQCLSPIIFIILCLFILLFFFFKVFLYFCSNFYGQLLPFLLFTFTAPFFSSSWCYFLFGLLSKHVYLLSQHSLDCLLLAGY